MVLHGRCDEDVPIPFRPIRELLTHYLASIPQGRLAGHDSCGLAELTRLVPELTQRLPQLPAPTGTDPQSERYLLFSAVAGLLGEIASGMPVILALDDLHWADRPTLLLRHLASAAFGRVLILGTYRDVEAVPGQSLAEALAALCREPTVEHIRLQGFAESAVAAVMAAMAGGGWMPMACGWRAIWPAKPTATHSWWSNSFATCGGPGC